MHVYTLVVMCKSGSHFDVVAVPSRWVQITVFISLPGEPGDPQPILSRDACLDCL